MAEKINPFIVSIKNEEICFVYIDLTFIWSTSNTAERLFCLSGRIYTKNRQLLSCERLKNILFLNQNKDFWDASTLNKLNVLNIYFFITIYLNLFFQLSECIYEISSEILILDQTLKGDREFLRNYM